MPVHVVMIGTNGAEFTVTDLNPGNSGSVPGFPGLTESGNPCRVVTLIARDLQHREVARHEGEICLDGQWNIGGPPDPAGSIVPAVVVIGLVTAAGGLVLARIAWLRVTA